MKHLWKTSQGRARWGFAFVLLFLAGGWSLIRTAGHAGDENWVSIERRDLVLTVDVSGTLKAVQSHLLGPPPVPRTWDFKISRMAPEGSEVKKGTPVLAFDASNLEQEFQEKKAEYEAAQREIEKKRNDIDSNRRNEELRLAEAEAKGQKAALKLERPSELVAPHGLRKLQIDLELAGKEVAFLKKKLVSLELAGEAELALLCDQRDRAAGRVRELEEGIARMTVVAPRDGTVVYLVSRRGEKKKVGDSCWLREKILEIPDLSEMMAEGQVDEADAGMVSVGQRVVMRLEAYPDAEYFGRLEAIGSAVQPAAPRSPLRVVPCKVTLDRTDPERMRPGMRFQGTIETGRISKALVMPLEAVFPKPDGPVVYRRSFTGLEEVRLELGRRNKRFVEVVEGLSEGDRISRRLPGTEES